MARKIMNIVVSLILILLVVLIVVIFAARLAGNSPSIFGYHIFRVASDSMTPTLQVGDVIVVKTVKPEEIHNGDIITYTGNVGDFRGKMITHRVVEDPYVEDGVYHLQTRGDKVGAVSDPEIVFEQVEGKYIGTIPYVDRLYNFFLSPGGLIAFIALIIVLFGYEMISLIVSYKNTEAEDEEYYAPKNRKPKKKRKK